MTREAIDRTKEITRILELVKEKSGLLVKDYGIETWTDDYRQLKLVLHTKTGFEVATIWPSWYPDSGWRCGRIMTADTESFNDFFK